MLIIFLAGICLIIASVIAISLYIIEVNNDHSSHLSKWFIIGFVAFALFFFLISPAHQDNLQTSFGRAAIICDIFSFLFLSCAVNETILFIRDRIKREKI